MESYKLYYFLEFKSNIIQLIFANTEDYEVLYKAAETSFWISHLNLHVLRMVGVKLRVQ